MTQPLLMTEKQAAAYLGVCTRTLAKWRKAGRVPAVKPDPGVSRLYYRRADLERVVAEMLEAAP